MITIKKGNVTLTFQKGDFSNAQDTPTGMYFKFRDGSEYILELDKANPQVKTIPAMIMRSTTGNILIDFNNPQQLVSIT